ncbi:MAG: type II toxin-antitoxin system HicB family antitoxin [Candidatus Aenigmatarchaeota archaeon]
MQTVPLPVILENGGKYVAAWCPIIDIATQGLNEEEARKNITELIKWYFEDKDTPKPKLKSIMGISLTIANVPVKISENMKGKNEAPCFVST